MHSLSQALGSPRAGNKRKWPPNLNPNYSMNKVHATLAIAGLLFASSAFAADVATNWENNCTSCHGADGRGDTKMGKKLKIKDLTDAKVQASFKDEDAVKAVKSGIRDANGKTTMKAIEGLTDEEINALVAHVRSLKK